MRHLLFTVLMIGIEILVVLHWFVFRESLPLFVLAMSAGVLMALMAAADLLLMIGVFRKDPAHPVRRVELRDLARIEPIWAVATVLQLAFLGAALAAGVYWMAAVLVLGQGAELIAIAVARVRTRAWKTLNAAQVVF